MMFHYEGYVTAEQVDNAVMGMVCLLLLHRFKLCFNQAADMSPTTNNVGQFFMALSERETNSRTRLVEKAI